MIAKKIGMDSSQDEDMGIGPSNSKRFQKGSGSSKEEGVMVDERELREL